MKVETVWHRIGTNINRARSDGSASAWPARNQQFLSYFLVRYGQATAAPLTILLIAISAGVGISSLVHHLTAEAAMPVRLAASITVGVVALASIHRKLAADYRLRCAAVALASGMLNANRDCLKVLSTDGKLLRVSEHGAALMEAESPDELSGADWLNFWNGNDRALAENACRDAVAGISTSFTGSCATTKGQKKWWNSTVSPIAGKDGSIVGLLCASEDVTQQCDLVKTLRERDELMHEMESHVRLVFYSYSPDFQHFHHVSAGVERVFGITAEQLATTPSAWLELVCAVDIGPLRAEMHRIASEGVEGRFEYRIRRPDGCLCWIRSTAYPVRDETGAVVRIVGVSEDITVEQERLAALDRLAHTYGR